MNIGKRFYWAAALMAILALAGAAVIFTSRLTSAGGSTPPADACDKNEGSDEASEVAGAEADAETNDDQCDAADANEAEDSSDAADIDEAEDGNDGEAQVQSGTLDDGKDLLPQAGITIDAAIAAAQSVGSGAIGEVDLEHWNGKLVFNVDVGDKDVKVDARNGAMLSADSDD